mgnify:FL=1
MRVYQIGANEAQQRLDKYLKKLLKEECTKIIILTRVRTLNKKISKTSHLICFYEQRLFFIIF